MQAGKLRHRGTIKTPVTTQDEAGQENAPDDENPSGQFTEVETRWCALRPLSGKQLEIARQLATEVTHEIIFRFFDYALGDVVEIDGRDFEVLYWFDPDELKRYLHIYAVERK